MKDWWLKRLYGISIDDYEAMVNSQNGQCKICSVHLEQPCVDHDHETGRVRGLLCSFCNRAIGLLHDDPQLCISAASYLQS